MTKNFAMRIANAVLFAAMVAVNVLANTLPLGDFNTGQISAMYPTLITPPGWTFAIWGLIYAALFVVIIRQLLDERYSRILSVGPWFILSCLANIGWIFSWHFRSMLPATVTILLLLLSLYQIYKRTRRADLFTKITFSIYYAWITAASLIMIFAAGKTLTGHAPITPIVPRSAVTPAAAAAETVPGILDQFTGIVLISGTPEIVSYVTVLEYICAVAALILLTVIAILHTRKYRDPAYLAVILWALMGILIRQATSITPPILFDIICAIAIFIAAYLMIDIFTTKKKGERK